MSARQSGQFVVSLDFELYWGIRDHTELSRCRERLLGVRKAVPAILELFRKEEIHCSWATVGFLMADGRDELERYLPDELPGYQHKSLNPYPALGSTGTSEQDDPFHYAPSLVRSVLKVPGQELAVHTFSHYYTLEAGARPSSFRADLTAWIRLAEDSFGVTPSAIVFPRNQYDRVSLEVCRDVGLTAYRGNLPQWLFNFGAEEERSQLRRAVRLADNYLPISGNNSVRCVDHELPGLVDVSASRFLRPYSVRLRRADALRLRRMAKDMTEAAKSGATYHLWWHPHNFGTNLSENLEMLRAVVDIYSQLRGRYGMRSRTMGEAAQVALATTASAASVN